MFRAHNREELRRFHVLLEQADAGNTKFPTDIFNDSDQTILFPFGTDEEALLATTGPGGQPQVTSVPITPELRSEWRDRERTFNESMKQVYQ